MLRTTVRVVLAAAVSLAAGLLPLRSAWAAAGARPAAAAVENAAPSPLALGAVYSLDQFVPKRTTPAEAQQAFDGACRQIRAKGGGVLLIPADAPANWTPANNSQEQIRIPDPPAPAKTWRAGPGVTVIDLRGGTVKIQPPQSTGLVLARTLNLPQGQSLPHWDYYPLVDMRNAVLHGATSYRDQIIEDVRGGPDARVYVNTIRGLFPGMFINCEAAGGVQRLYIKTLGYDPPSRRWYFTADLTADVRKGTYLSNKNHVNIVRLATAAHNENQTFDLCLWRHNYSQGDNYLIDARFKYMGDVHSTGGDENGVLFAGFIESLTNIFRGEVASWDPARAELVYQPNARNADTLGSGRPIINLNPKKWLTAGSVVIVRPASRVGGDDAGGQEPVYQGRTYPTTLGEGRAGGQWLYMGGLIRFSKDAPVDESAIGRYFAVDEEDEYVPGTSGAAAVRRWYLIDSVRRNADGTTDIQIIRHWWGAKPAGSPTLYKPENYSSDGHVKPLKYIIAPGVNAYDVSDGVQSRQVNANGCARIIRLSPAPFAGTGADFAPDDPIEQAIGPDPFRPVPFRSWLFEKVPGAYPAPVFDIANMGIQRASVLAVRGGRGDLDEDLATRYDRSPVWDEVIRVEATSRVGVDFLADTQDAAILFRQPHGKAQAVKWRYEDGKKEASLTVSPADGTLKFDGNGVSLNGGAARVGGLSGSDVPAKNLRGIAVPVPAGRTDFTVTFPKPEADEHYAVFVETNWLTARAVAKQTAEGFTVQFEKRSQAGAVLHWFVVR